MPSLEQTISSDLASVEQVVNTVLSDLKKIPGLGTIASDIQWVLNQIGDIGSFVAKLEGILDAVGADLINAIMAIMATTQNAGAALLAMLEFVLLLLQHLLPVINSSSSMQQRRDALSQLNPFKKYSALYNFITQPSNDAAFNMLVLAALVIFLVVNTIVDPASLPILLSYIKGNTVGTFVDMIRLVVSAVADGADPFSVLYKLVMDYFALLIGVPIGPATALTLTYQIISGLPIPPVMAIVDTIAADPIAQQYIGKSLHLPGTITQKVMPVAMQCLNAADAGQWFSCLSGVIEVVFPKVISGLQDYAIDVNDLRTIVQSAWETGGDPHLMFGATISAARSGFSGARTVQGAAQFTSTQSAAVGVGFFGVDYVADKIGIKNADGFFMQSLAQIFPSDVQKYIQGSYDVFRFAEQLIIENGYVHLQLNHKTKPTGFVLYLLKQFHAAQWDVEIAMSQIIADEFDPSNKSLKFFSLLTKPGMITPAFKALITKLVIDFPRMGFMINMLLQKLQMSATAAIGTSATIASAQATWSHKIPGTAAHSSSPSFAPATDTSGLAAGGSAQPASSGPGWASIAATAAAGFAVAGPAGALVGAAASLLVEE